LRVFARLGTPFQIGACKEVGVDEIHAAPFSAGTVRRILAVRPPAPGRSRLGRRKRS
jgi:hypothetical protein